jgi:hypothetical protein
MPTNLVTDAETLAINTLTFLASQVGEATLQGVLNVVLGQGEQVLSEELSQLAGGIAASVLNAIGPDKVKAAMTAIFAAADKVVDKLEDAKFPPEGSAT